MVLFWIWVVASLLVVSRAQNQDFIVECVRPLGIQVTPTEGFRIVQINCKGQFTNKELLPPYNVDSDCLVPTETGTAVEFTIESTAVDSPFLGGFLSRTYRVSCNFPDSTGYSDTLVQQLQGAERAQGVEPTQTSGVFRFTGIMMTILDRASYAAKQWTDHLSGTALIGQDLYLTISHPQRDEGPAYIIPQQCRVKPETGNFTTLWSDQSSRSKCLEVQGLIRESFSVFSDPETATDVTSLQFYGFQFLNREKDALTFECDVFLCGDVSRGPCGETWTLLKDVKGCIDSAALRQKRSAEKPLAQADAYADGGHTLSVRIRVLLPRHHYVASGSSFFSSAIVVLIVLAAKLFDVY